MHVRLLKRAAGLAASNKQVLQGLLVRAVTKCVRRLRQSRCSKSPGSAASELGPLGIAVVSSPGCETALLSIYKADLRTLPTASSPREVDVLAQGPRPLSGRRSL